MGSPLIDLAGRRFGALTVIREEGRIGKFKSWLCRCDCGELVEVIGKQLRQGRRKTCFRNGHNWAAESWKGHQPTKKPPEYRVWERMIERCYRAKHHRYASYGGRGIKVCDRWRKSFKAFLEDMGSRPSSKHSIGRIDNDGDYEPTNCRWETDREQRRNKRDTVYVEYNGNRVKLIDLLESLGITYSNVASRLKIGWSLDEAITTPIRPKRKNHE